MPDPLDQFLAEQEAADLAEFDQHIDRRERRMVVKPRPVVGNRDRAAVVAELESGSDEIETMDKALEAGQTGTQR